MQNNMLLHTCCGPCAVECVEYLKNEGAVADLFFYNPNIHPYLEYKARLESAEKFADIKGLKFLNHKDYCLEEFLDNVDYHKTRCEDCYKLRLEETAKYASKNGYKSFSTTLLVSPYQNHEKIIELATEAGKKYGIDFYYFDPRENFRKGQQQARELGLYMQKYCGCVFSEYERFCKS